MCQLQGHKTQILYLDSPGVEENAGLVVLLFVVNISAVNNSCA